MEKILLIIRHAFVSFSGSVLVTILAFFLKFYLVHRLIDATFSLGVFALGISMIEFFSPFSSVGFGGVAARYIPKWNINSNMKKINHFITSAVLFSLALSLLYAITFYLNQGKIFSMLNVRADQSESIIFLSFLPFFLILMIVRNITGVINQILIGLQEVRRSVVASELIGFPLKCVLVFLFIYIGWDLKGILYAEIISTILILFSFLYILHRTIGVRYRFRISLDWIDKKIMGYALTFFLLAILAKFSNVLDKWLIKEYMSLKVLGIYYMTFAFVDFLPFILGAINKIFAPIVSEIWEQKKLFELQSLYRFFTKWTLLLSFPMFFCVVFFSDDLLLLFGSEFVKGRYVLIILAIAHLFSISLGSVRTILQMTDNHVSMFVVTVFKTILVIILLFLLVPKFQMEGAALSLGIGIIINNVLNYIVLYKRLKLTPYGWYLWRILLVIFFSSFVLILSFDYFSVFIVNMHWYWLILSLIYTYVITIMFSRILCFSEQDKLVLIKLLNKSK